jgi:hypothetical protein
MKKLFLVCARAIIPPKLTKLVKKKNKTRKEVLIMLALFVISAMCFKYLLFARAVSYAMSTGDDE